MEQRPEGLDIWGTAVSADIYKLYIRQNNRIGSLDYDFEAKVSYEAKTQFLASRMRKMLEKSKQ